MAIDRLLAGAMSGTSADGVDVALVHITGEWPQPSVKLVHHHHRPYDLRLRQSIFAMRSQPATTLCDMADLGRDISLTYAAAVNEALCAAGKSESDLDAVAAHGQTLYHAPPNTIQWLDPALIAAEVGCEVISDFRRADCAAGGQGAPLVPFADYILFRHPTKNRVLLNIGGIANLTYLPANCALDQVIAFDTGPGNCISDYLCRKYFSDGPGYDEGGRMAGKEGADAVLAIEILETNPYFSQRPPRSTDGPAMIAMWEKSVTARRLERRPECLLATACLLTAMAISESMLLTLPDEPSEVIASGGGVHNQATMSYLREAIAARSHRLMTVEEVGCSSAAKEAVAFAILGAATLDRVPANVPRATGARYPVVLGSITPRPRFV